MRTNYAYCFCWLGSHRKEETSLNSGLPAFKPACLSYMSECMPALCIFISVVVYMYVCSPNKSNARVFTCVCTYVGECMCVCIALPPSLPPSLPLVLTPHIQGMPTPPVSESISAASTQSSGEYGDAAGLGCGGAGTSRDSGEVKMNTGGGGPGWFGELLGLPQQLVAQCVRSSLLN